MPEARDLDRAPDPLIRSVRGRSVILDAELARLYGVSTKSLNQAVKRNLDRFPDDFAFRLNAVEYAQVRRQLRQAVDHEGNIQNRSQIVTGSQKHRGAWSRPRAFTEHGALMVANVLRSKRAVRMSIYVIRAFIRLRERAVSDAAILRRLAEIDGALLEHDVALRDIYQKLLPLLRPPAEPSKRRIGFHTDGA